MRPFIVLLVLAVIVVPAALDGWPDPTLAACLTASGLALLWWRTHPRAVALAGGGFWLAGALLAEHVWFPEPAFVILALLATVVPLGFRTWHAATGVVALLAGLYFVNGETNPVPLLVFSLPGFLAGTVLRARRETASQLAARGRELEEERELYADLALRHERARIAAELHDIVGHAISVMIIQAAAGQRLVDRDPERTRETFTAIAESARQGRGDLQRLVDLLGGGDAGNPDLALIDEVVTRAARSGLDVACRFENRPGTVAAPVAHLAFRVVQESITNALRHASGAAVRVTVGGSSETLVVRVENAPATALDHLPGTGRGLTGLRERIQQLGGRLTAGPAGDGGWTVEARLPISPPT
ncbi:two-component sensor histidine kinase [Actinoplanes italicus]|uniref:histidine kinase n=1 Tax=Actinoplanes italicus TaxID=113567 RepID=A0A2T0K8Y4_9ACTN|nr:histidine kinase [Actinoplanes italicus]PRX19353.1 signal transduction histidine kinase [Actinoplanes italicus]GIE30630.1 two-component sensor histidine kinase [Actinoplanes italicus]